MGDKAGIKTEPCGEDSTENIGSTDAGDYFYHDDILVMEAGTYQFTARGEQQHRRRRTGFPGRRLDCDDRAPGTA